MFNVWRVYTHSLLRCNCYTTFTMFSFGGLDFSSFLGRTKQGPKMIWFGKTGQCFSWDGLAVRCFRRLRKSGQVNVTKGLQAADNTFCGGQENHCSSSDDFFLVQRFIHIARFYDTWLLTGALAIKSTLFILLGLVCILNVIKESIGGYGCLSCFQPFTAWREKGKGLYTWLRTGIGPGRL